MPKKTSAATKKMAKKHVIIICALAVVLCAAAVTIILLLTNTNAKAANGAKVINQDNIKTIKEDVKDKVAKGMFATFMNTTWVFPEGKEASKNAVMGNSASNNYPLYFTVTLSDTKEVVYTSSLLPVGSQVDKIVLEKDLDKGTYPAVVNIHMVDEKNEEIDSNMGFNISLVIQK